MVKKKTKKKARKKLTPLEKIKKELDKLEALHAKEEAIVENITDIIDEEQHDEDDYDFDKWEGTNGD
jgi:GTPase involved in cell partitioning and DNA repair